MIKLSYEYNAEPDYFDDSNPVMKKVVETKLEDLGVTWPTLVHHFLEFLNACGYIIDKVQMERAVDILVDNLPYKQEDNSDNYELDLPGSN